jgi:hypothetical protein
MLLVALMVLVPAVSYPINPPVWSYQINYGQNHSEVCLGGFDGKGDWGYISLHDDWQLYNVWKCYANERWNLIFQ